MQLRDEVIVKLCYGKINLVNSGGTLGAFQLKPPFVRAMATQSGALMGKPIYSNASRFPDIGGGFTTKNISHPPGTVIMIQASRTRRAHRMADGIIFLRLRAQAAVLVVKMKLPTGPDSILGEYQIAFTGRADVLSVEELASMDILVPNNIQHLYLNMEEIDELFEIEEIGAEITPAPTLVRIATSQGVQLRAVADEPVRRLRLRR